MRKKWFDFVDWIRYWFGAETRDEAWISGSRDAEEDFEYEHLRLEAFIEEQSWLIYSLMEIIDRYNLWEQASDEVIERIRDYR